MTYTKTDLPELDYLDSLVNYINLDIMKSEF